MKTYNLQIQFIRTDPELIIQVVAHGTNGDVLWAASADEESMYSWPLVNVQTFITPFSGEDTIRGTHDQLDDEDEC